MKRFLKYLPLLKPVRGVLLLAVVCGLLYGLTSGFGVPVLVKTIYPVIFQDAGTLSTPEAILYCLAPILLFVVRATSGHYNTYLMCHAGQALLEQLRRQVFEKLQRLPLAYYRDRNPGDLISRSMQDTGIIQIAMIEVCVDIVKQPITLIGAITFLGYQCYLHNDIFFLLAFIAATPLCIGVVRFVGKKLRVRVASMQTELAQLTSRLTANLSAIREIRAFCMEKREIERFQKASEVYRTCFMKTAKYNIILTPIIDVIASVGISIAFFYAWKTSIPPETFLSLCLALYLCYDPVKKLGRIHNKIQEGQAGLDRIEAILDEPEPIQDPPHPTPVTRLKGDIRFENVTFAYTEEPILKDLTIHLEPGKTYALVGPSGAGKSTFANLIPRFYDVVQGRISIDGMDIRQMRQSDLRRNIAIVSQEPLLFNDTLGNNILVGDFSASRERVIEASKKAFAHDFISAMEQGYETDAGQAGARLSGGQKQRIAIARAFLREAPILIFDEATSALDAESEGVIQQALANLSAGRTVILIAHRFSSIRHADEILVFDQGRIVERGPHALLMEKNGLYAALSARQAL